MTISETNLRLAFTLAGAVMVFVSSYIVFQFVPNNWFAATVGLGIGIAFAIGGENVVRELREL